MPNTLNLHRYGRYTAGAPEGDTGLINAGASRACVFDALTKNVWWTKGGFVGGKVSSNAAARISVYDSDSAKNPDERLGYMAPVTVSTVMVGGGDGTHYTADVAHSDNGPTDDAIMGWSGVRHAFDLLAGTASMRHSMAAAADIVADNEQFYDRAAPSNPPPTVYGAASESTQGQLTAYLEGWENVAPQTPLQLEPTGSVTETAPLFTMTFRDKNGTYGTTSGDGVDTGDQVNQVQIQVRQVGTTTLLWNLTYSATSAEKSSDDLERAYGGSTLTRGVTYEWRARTSDAFGTWGSFSGWESFTPASLGYVTLDSTPTGKQEAITGIDFKGRWNHQTATTMKTVQVRLLDQNNTVLQTGAVYNIADVASSALPGTLFTVPWADTGFDDLGWGRSYKYQIRGNDGTTWSDWSLARSFTTNAAPTIASPRSPASGAIVTDYPLITFAMTDADDDVAGDLEGWVFIENLDTTTTELVQATYNPTSGLWEFQTTSAELPTFDEYQFWPVGFDGTLWSGETATSAAARDISPSRIFSYAAGPVLTITSPADLDTVTTASLDVAWTVDSGGPQVKYRVELQGDGTGVDVYDSGWITSVATTHAIPSGYLRNGVSYDLQVSVQNATPLTGTSAIVNIDVAFTPPDPVANVQATAVAIGNDAFPTAIRLTWDQTAYATPEFIEYIVTRRADGGPDAAETVLLRLASPSETTFTDYTPASGYEYTYGLSISILTGADTITSDPVEVTETVTLLGVVLSLATNGGTYRTCLLNARSEDHSRSIDEAVYQSPAAEKPTTVRAIARVWSMNFEAALFAKLGLTAKQRLDEFDALDAQQSTVCVRTSRGVKRFVKITTFDPTHELPDWWSVKFGLREEAFTEGEP